MRGVGLDDPDLVPKANADRHALATEFGLFSADRRFLPALAWLARGDAAPAS